MPSTSQGGLVFACLAVLWAASAFAQAASTVAAHLPPADDKTGTNPLNLQETVETDNTFASVTDNLFLDTVSYRYSITVGGRRVAAGVRLPIVVGNITGRTELGFGSLGARVLWTPWLSARTGVLTGLDTAWNIATNEALTTGRHILEPLVQVVLQPTRRTLVAPWYRHQFSVGGDDDDVGVHRARLGLYTLWRPTEDAWVIVEPEIVFDLENDDTYGEVAFEFGRLLLDHVSTYVRPGVALGERTAGQYDWSLGIGFRIIP